MSWMPTALRDPGPPEKTGYAGVARNAGAGAVYHSMAGRFEDARARLMGDDRVSWHFSVLSDGRIYQHYPVEAVCWHAGTLQANAMYVGIEHEGGWPPTYNDPLTPAQLQSSVVLTRWLMRTLGWPEFRVGEQGMEHNWIVATACPAGRIPWNRIREGVTQVDQELRDRIRAAAAFEAAAALIKAGLPASLLSQEQKAVIRWIAAQLQ